MDLLVQHINCRLATKQHNQPEQNQFDGYLYLVVV